MKTYNVKIKFKNHDEWLEYNDIYVIPTLKEYSLYLIEFNNKFDISAEEIKTPKTFVGHGHSLFTGLVGTLNGKGMIENIDKREPMLLALRSFQATVLKNQLDDLLKGKSLVINKNGGYFTIKNDGGDEYQIIETGKKLYSKSDIKTNKWWGGQHYYAKVDNVDVIDNSGNVKWNSEKTAYEMAEVFMEKLNNRV